MSALISTRIGPYEIVSALGAGGMGEVYRARDTKLNRDVAIKVLLPAVANDPDRLARFSREAQVLASLNHPNIAAIYGLEEGPAEAGRHIGTDVASGFPALSGVEGSRITALVMELVEGEDLSQRIARGSIPLDEALPIARQIAEALEAAHDLGIIHRDLKPANIKVRPDGTVKVLDFGLAKAVDPTAGSSATAMNSPTLSIHATQAGIILGTAAYMSPEQARGKAVDKRADIWAFGALLFEMLTGKRAFPGDDATDTIVAVISKDPEWTALPPSTPPAIRTVLRRALEKDPKRRLDSAAGLRIEIDDAHASPMADTPLATSPRRSRGARFALAVAGALLILAGATAGWVARRPPSADAVAFEVATPGSRRLDGFALSPDGRQLVFGALDPDGRERLWLRPLASAEARVLPGTEQALSPSWSPDSRHVAYFAGNELKRVDVSGGAIQVIGRTSGNPGGGTWNNQQTILFGTSGNPVHSVPASGGTPQPITSLQPGESSHLWPVFMPDGRHFVYLNYNGGLDSELRWRALDAPETTRVVRPMMSKPFYSSSGHLVFRLNGPIVGQAFDPATGTVSGEPIQITPNAMQVQSQTGLALSSAGALAYRASTLQALAQLSWLDRSGKILTTLGEAANYSNPATDAAGERAVVNTGPTGDIWVLEGRRGTTSRLTFDAATDSDAIFSPDGRSVAFFSRRNPPGIYRNASSGAGADELIAATGPATYPRHWSPDGQFLLFDSGPTGRMWALPMTGDRKPFRYPTTQPEGSQVSSGYFSPDGKWVVYVSDEFARPEIFVQDFPAAAAKFQVSVGGGSEPRWRPDGREIFYLAPDGRMMAVPVETTPTFRAEVPAPLFQTQLNVLAFPARRYGVSADGRRFLMNVPMGAQTVPPITVLLNWQGMLRQ